MHFLDLPLTEHPLVFLRPIVAADLPVWYAYLSLPEVHGPTSWDVRSADELSSNVWSESMREPDRPMRLAVARRTDGRLVGTIGFHTVSARHKSAEITYDLSPEIQGKGIATALCRELTEWAHGSAGMVRVQAATLFGNDRSARVLERSGYVREGLLRAFRQVRGVAGDFWMYAHIRENRT